MCLMLHLLHTLRHTDGDPSIVKLYSTSDDVDGDVMMRQKIVLLQPMLWVLPSMLTAEMSETVLAGSSISVAFGTGTNVVLTAAKMVH